MSPEGRLLMSWNDIATQGLGVEVWVRVGTDEQRVVVSERVSGSAFSKYPILFPSSPSPSPPPCFSTYPPAWLPPSSPQPFLSPPSSPPSSLACLELFDHVTHHCGNSLRLQTQRRRASNHSPGDGAEISVQSVEAASGAFFCLIG